MSKRPDKYPEIDPRAPGLYRRILEAAQEMRAGQQACVTILELQRRAARVASLEAAKRWEAEDLPPVTVVVPVPTVAPSPVNSGPHLAGLASED
jgi:hypothetical protein